MLSVFISYVGYIWIKYGVQTSISESYYRLPWKKKHLFVLFCWGFAMSAIIASIDITPLMFGAGVGISFVGAAAEFKKRLSRTVHYVGAIGGIAFSQLAILLGFDMLILNIIFLSSTALLLAMRSIVNNYFWWIEIIAFCIICLAIGLKIW
jgi:hypothetical protein